MDVIDLTIYRSIDLFLVGAFAFRLGAVDPWLATHFSDVAWGASEKRTDGAPVVRR